MCAFAQLKLFRNAHVYLPHAYARCSECQPPFLCEFGPFAHLAGFLHLPSLQGGVQSSCSIGGQAASGHSPQVNGCVKLQEAAMKDAKFQWFVRGI